MNETATTLNIEQILALSAKNDTISDIHLSWGEVIAFRVNGEIQRYEQAGKLTTEMIEIILKQLMKGNPKTYEKFVGDKDMDFAYLSNDGTAYRVNAYMKLGNIGIVMRKINDKAKTLEELMFQDMAQTIREKILTMRKWLFLVTGPTWSGKSTSMVSMLEYINQTRNENILTIEDPIEFIFQPNKSLFSQREIGHDTRGFINALKAAMREDPDVIFVGEIRDKETAEAALNLSETGHLVFSTLHTSSAAGTVNRYISFFPPEIQDSVADRLSDTLIGVQSQFLVKTLDNANRVWVFELMLNTTAIRNNIKKRELPQMDSIIETSSGQWMVSLAQYAKRLVEKNIVAYENVERIFTQKQQS